MSTPKVITDGTTELNEAALNKFICAGEANKSQVKCWYGRVRFTGSTWEVVSTSDSAGLTTGALAWASSQLQITLSGWTNPPLIVATPVADDDANYTVKAYASSNVLAVVRFYNIDTGALITTQAATMDFNVLILGA
jgi:hypothetical protein